MDIVIPVKSAMINEELRYCLRSISKNFPHDRVWLAGYKPSWVSEAVGFITVNVPLGSKYKKAAENILVACRDDRVSDNFYLFNDDFFVMKPIEKFEDRCRGTMKERLTELAGNKTPYRYGLELAIDILKELGVRDPVDYGLHVPIAVNKGQWLEAWGAQSWLNREGKPVHMRSIYGNLYKKRPPQISDVKIADFDAPPPKNSTFLSTNDDSFAQGEVGKYVREMFPDKCVYENGA